MRLAFFDASAGISGDMILGAMVDAGLGYTGLKRELEKLALDGYDLSTEEVCRAGFRACRVHVLVREDHVHERKLADILAMLDGSRLTPDVAQRAKQVFCRLAEAEARVHGIPIAETHLHEVGAIDALVDVVGAVAGLAALGVQKVICSPLRLGYGSIDCEHGTLPIPAPAVAELLRGVPVYGGDIEGEMVTPTGAAIVTTLAEAFGSLPRFSYQSLGIGAGAVERRLPNILRLFLGETVETEEENAGELVVMEANLDDMNPQFFDYLGDRLRANGALDVWLTPVQMKKGRPGTILSVLAVTEGTKALREIIFCESSTLGLREYQVLRYALKREFVQVVVAGRTIPVKVGWWRNKIVQVAPEYEVCRQIAAELAIPLKQIYDQALGKAMACLGVEPNGTPDGGNYGHDGAV